MFSAVGKLVHKQESHYSDDRLYPKYRVSEGGHMNAFLSAQVFEAWGCQEIPQSAHTQVYGYANAWEIDPRQANGQSSYTIALEHTGQRMIYPLLLLSAFGLFGTILFGVILSKHS
jgi:hypothetical protein